MPSSHTPSNYYKPAIRRKFDNPLQDVSKSFNYNRMTLFYENKLNPIGVKLKNAMARSKILKEKKEFEMNKAARVIQKAFRRYLARKKGGRSVFAKKKNLKVSLSIRKSLKLMNFRFL